MKNNYNTMEKESIQQSRCTKLKMKKLFKIWKIHHLKNLKMNGI